MRGEVCCALRDPTVTAMRNIETIDSELRLLLAIRQMVREEEGRTPTTAHITSYWTSA
jgi:hypothetical protein